MSTDRKNIRICFEKWFTVLPRICAIESPWCYLCLSALIDYLSSAAYPGQKQWKRYPAFIENFFPAKYRRFKFKFNNAQQDLPEQMYYILRNGLTHSFSLFPDLSMPNWGGRIRSIVLAHRSNAGGRPHLSPHSSTSAPDAVLFIAEDFLADTKWAAYKLLREAKRGSSLEKSVLARFTAQPPIEWKS